MKKKHLRFVSILLILLGGIMVNLYAYKGGVVDSSNAPSESNCTSCHTTYALNSGPGTLSITHTIPVEGYYPDSEYVFYITTSQFGASVFGIDAVTLNGSSQQIGTLVPYYPIETRTIMGANNRVHLTHQLNGGLVSNVKTFVFKWIAPSANAGNVSLYVSTLAGNLDSAATGDYVYAKNLILTAVPTLAVFTQALSSSIFCSGQKGIVIPYSITGVAYNGNKFYAQLSNELGSFATPDTIGSVTSRVGGSIITTKPLPNILGTKYRIRVVASAPSTVGTIGSTAITIRQSPTESNAGTDQLLCDTVASLTANTPVYGVGSWSVISGKATIQNPASPATTVSNLSDGVNAFVWSISNSTCPISRDTVYVIRKSIPTPAQAGVDQLACLPSIYLTGNTPVYGVGNWSALNNGAKVENPNLSRTKISSLDTGISLFVYSISNAPCAASMDTVAVSYTGKMTEANAGLDVHVCDTQYQLLGNQPLDGVGHWSILQGKGYVVVDSVYNTNLNGISDSVTSLVWTITKSACYPSSDTLVIFKDKRPDTSYAGLDQTICGDSIVLISNQPAVGIGKWKIIRGNAKLSDTLNALVEVSRLSAGINSFTWNISNGVCATSIDTVNVQRYANSTIANAGLDKSVCATTTLLEGNSPVAGTGTWSVFEGSAQLADIHQPNTSVSNLSYGRNGFIWTILNGTCPPSIDTVYITRMQNPTVSNAGSNQYLCTDSLVLNGNVPLIGKGVWSIASGLANLKDTLNPNALVTGMGIGDYVFSWIISNPPCAVSASNVIIHNCNNNSITTGNVNAGPFCDSMDYSISVPYTTTGIFRGFYLAELSDSSGSFKNPITIGSGKSPILATLPKKSPRGSSFKIRVTNSYPPIIGTESNSIQINTCIPNTIVTGEISGSPFCENTSYQTQVPFSITGTMTGDYTAQLSDDSGRFVSPLAIGTGASSPIAVIIPNTTKPGNLYAVRVVNSGMNVTGTPSTTALSINTCKTILIDSVYSSPFCKTTSYTLKVKFKVIGQMDPPFVAELSDSVGDFSAPVNLGLVYDQNFVGNISPITPKGNKYRLRFKHTASGFISPPNKKDLSINTCNTDGLDEEDAASFKVYPMPFSTTVHLQFPSSIRGVVKVNIRDMLGKIIEQQLVKVGMHAEVEYHLRLPLQGMFLMEVETEKGMLRKAIHVRAE